MKGLETRRGKGEKWKRNEWEIEKKMGLKEMKTINKAQAPKHGEMGERGGTKRERGISSTLNITSNTV